LVVRVRRTLFQDQRQYLRLSIAEREKKFKGLRRPSEARRVYEYRIRKRLQKLPQFLADLFEDMSLEFKFLFQQDRFKEFEEAAGKVREEFKRRGMNPLGFLRLCFNMEKAFAEYFQNLPSDSISELILSVKEKMHIGDLLRVAGSFNMLVEQVNREVARLKTIYPERVEMQPEVNIMYDISEDFIKQEENGTKHFMKREHWTPLYYLFPTDLIGEGDFFTRLKKRLVESEWSSRNRQLDRWADELSLEGIRPDMWASEFKWLKDRKSHLEIFNFIAENTHEKPEATVSRDSIMKETGLTRRRVTRLCNQLIREKLIAESNMGQYKLTKYGGFLASSFKMAIHEALSKRKPTV